MTETTETPHLSPFDEMCKTFDLDFSAIKNARQETESKIGELRNALSNEGLTFDGSSVSLVVFGSMARREWTNGSDVDWTLLIDGPADPYHFQLASAVRKTLSDNKFAEPGATGIFGSLTSSHDLVHYIGGQEDTNLNMTRRLLLLLESRAIAENDQVHQRVLKAVLNRYIVCGSGLREKDNTEFTVPRFLLNDVVRYWRTIAVDYAAKKWERANEKWALRNAKLRVSRKLIFVKGLLLCLDCELFTKQPLWDDLSMKNAQTSDAVEERQLVGTEKIAKLTAIDLLSRVLILLEQGELAKRIFSRYNEFLSLMNSPEERSYLETLTFEDAAGGDEKFAHMRHEIGGAFGEALEDLFFAGPQRLLELTRKYGVF